MAEREIRHAVMIHGNDGGWPMVGHALEIGSDVVVGEGIVLAAVLGHDLGELAGGDRLCAFEHQMLEEMGDARGPRRLVGSADLVPDHLGYDGSAMVGDDQDLEAVPKGEFDDTGGGTGAVNSDRNSHGGEA